VTFMADPEFTPLQTMSSILSRWWIPVVMAVLGGIVGWVFHFFYPTVYEATSNLTVTMDFSQRELTQYEQDYAFNAAGAIINSTAVKDQIVTKVQIDGIQISSTQLAQRMLSEGKQSIWELHTRDLDPQVAAKLANTWAQVADEALNGALEHAIQAKELQVQIDMLSICLPLALATPGPGATLQPAPGDCGRYSLAELQTAMQSWTDKLVQEKSLSMGILPIMEFALTSYASIPEKPVLFNQASLILSGSLIGFVISLWVAGSRRVQRRG
jgi:uncharacterized protein involved in exopolysaccharide biosynthesis